MRMANVNLSKMTSPPFETSIVKANTRGKLGSISKSRFDCLGTGSGTHAPASASPAPRMHLPKKLSWHQSPLPGASSPDLLNNYAFTLQITGPHELEFSTSQSFDYLTSSQYVFAGDSNNQMTSSPGGTVTTTVYSNDTFVGNDSTFSGNPVFLSSANTPVLLAALTLDATITSPGDSYTVSLIPASGNGSINSSTQTYFDLYNFNTGVETSAVPFTSTPGTVTISAATVPEPSSMALALTVILISMGVVGVRRLRRREPI